MKKLCLLIVVFVLLTGCVQKATQGNNSSDNRFVSLDVFAINDMHGKIADTDAQPGVDELSTYLKQAKKSRNTVVLSSGDMWQGAAESNLTGGFIVTEWMNEMNFSAMTLGGHEFDWGEAQIRENQKLAEFPFLAINIYSKKTNDRVDYCKASVMLDIDGAKIGIIGAIGNCYYSISSENTEDIFFKTGDELTELVKQESKKLRNQGADFIIYCIHDGYNQNNFDANAMNIDDEKLKDYYDVSLSDGYVDLVFEGDTHYTYTLKDRHGVYHLQAGGNNSGISYAGIMIDKTGADTTVFAAKAIGCSEYRYLADDPIAERLLKKYDAQIDPANKNLGVNGQYRGKDFICQTVADLYCEKGVEKWGDKYDIVLAGGYMSCRSPGYLSAGEVTYSQLVSLLPFDNEITLCSIKGRDLINRFLENEHYAYYIKTTKYGESIKENINPAATYYVVTDTYTANYAYNNMTVIDTYAADVFARDLLAEFIANGALE